MLLDNGRINGGYYQFPHEVAQSLAYRSLSGNAAKILHRLVLEHTLMFRKQNGNLIVTHRDLRDEYVTHNRIVEAIDELDFKGLIKVAKGKGHGTALVSTYTVTFYPTSDGLKPTDDFKKCDLALVEAWQKRAASYRKKRTEKAKEQAAKREAKKIVAPDAWRGAAPDVWGVEQKIADSKSNKINKTATPYVGSTINNLGQLPLRAAKPP
ncbi:hypothetical protein FHS21_005218 [Phyllobacterium trifolii]|uniref:Uncharacterized protein n=1 Tax=Phyllobacterium trifolii TaxID=300193 RepID=A0A839UIR8_9HYPH|nr:hypothetical protein [Phyllobacterium trifolii]MBB3148770.1 hypothetical protein [Phyllobacterium trifolii]